MKKLIFTNWNFMRLLRLIVGIAAMFQAFILKDIMFFIAGLLISVMAIFNMGCCGSGSCESPSKKVNENRKEIIYEEVV